MKELTREELIRRIQIIEGDITNLYVSLESRGIDTTVEDGKGRSLGTFYTNIAICCDIDDNGVPTDKDGIRVETEWLSPKEYNNKNKS